MFGAIPSRFLTPRDHPARDSQVHNLDNGLMKPEEAIKGLSTVAFRMSTTKAADTIDASTFLESSFGSLMLVPTATTIVSLGMWLSIQPDDDEIGTVMSGWSTVADEIGHVSALARMTSDGDPLPRSVWDDNARNAFDTWALNIRTEVAQAADEARGAIRTLDDTLLAVQEIQRIMVRYDEFTAVALATLAGAGMTPVFAGQARIAQQFIATFNRCH